MSTPTRQLVYRVENTLGRGPYVSGALTKAAYSTSVHHFTTRYDEPCACHPAPFKDPGLKASWNQIYEQELESNYYFGFTSKDQLYSWFYYKPINRVLNQLDCRISVYAVLPGNIRTGTYQCIFKRCHLARVIDRQDLPE